MHSFQFEVTEKVSNVFFGGGGQERTLLGTSSLSDVLIFKHTNNALSIDVVYADTHAQLTFNHKHYIMHR